MALPFFTDTVNSSMGKHLLNFSPKSQEKVLYKTVDASPTHQ